MSLCSLSCGSWWMGLLGVGRGANSRPAALRGPCFQPKKEFVPGVRGLAECELSSWGGGADSAPPSSQRTPLFSLPKLRKQVGDGGSLESLINLGREPAPCCGSPDAPTVLRPSCGPGFSLELDVSKVPAGALLKTPERFIFAVQGFSSLLAPPPASLANTHSTPQTTYKPPICPDHTASLPSSAPQGKDLPTPTYTACTPKPNYHLGTSRTRAGGH